MNISTTRSSSRSILAACLRLNAISDIKQLLLCDPYNIALLKSSLAFNKGNIYNGGAFDAAEELNDRVLRQSLTVCVYNLTIPVCGIL